MAKILLFTDPHFCSYSSILRKRGDRFSMRLENQLQTMNWLKEVAEEHQCFAIFCLGDFFDRAQLNSEEITAASEIEFGNIPVYFIVGNHEMGAADLKYSSSHVFQQDVNFEVLNKPAVLGIGETLFYVLPYDVEAKNKDTILELFPNVPPCKHRVLLTHNDLRGMVLGKFVTESGLNIDTLAREFDLVVNGHLHNQSWANKKVFNLGNITGQNFGEDAFKYKHQCMILDTDTLEYSLIDNPHAFNFYKLDFTVNNDIDYINKVSSTLKNAIVTIKVLDTDVEYIRQRFDPDYDGNPLFPKNCNVVCCRLVIERNLKVSETEVSTEDLHLDHHAAFRKYVLSTFEHNDILQSELEEILK